MYLHTSILYEAEILFYQYDLSLKGYVDTLNTPYHSDTNDGES